MDKRMKLVASLLVLLLTSMCTFYDQSGAVTSPNGLSCQNRTDYKFVSGQQFAECYYQCPDGAVKQPEIAGAFSEASPLYSASKADLDAQFCSESDTTTATRPPATGSPTEAASVTASPVMSPTELAPVSPTPETTVANPPPLLRGDVSMCDVGGSLISFRMIEPPPDLTGKTLDVQIADQNTSCSVNPANTSLLTCAIPASVLFPARVVVRVDDAVVNDFIYDGTGCARITTAIPTPAP